MRGATEQGTGRLVDVVKAVAAAWMRGWTAFVGAMGEPYLSMAGRVGSRPEAPPDAEEGWKPDGEGGWRQSA